MSCPGDCYVGLVLSSGHIGLEDVFPSLGHRVRVTECRQEWLLPTPENLPCLTVLFRTRLVWKSVPADKLEEEVNSLAETLAKVPYGLLAVHKRVVNMAIELMGRGLLQQLAVEGDAIGHLDPICQQFGEIASTEGLKAALDWRDSRFADYRTSEEAQETREKRGK